ncbi:NUMOD4 motif-containing HNH endonuclease [Mycobacterium sp. ML4]
MKWRPVVGFEGRYEVSDTGLIRSLDRIIEARNGSRWRPQEPGVPGVRRLKGRVIKPGRHKETGHLHVVLEGRVDRKVHTLVLEAFVGPCPPGLMARHADDNPANNHIGNLSWGTRSQNSYDAVRNGRHWQVNKTHCKHGHPLSGDNLRLSPDGHRLCKECGRRRGREHLARKRLRQAR